MQYEHLHAEVVAASDLSLKAQLVDFYIRSHPGANKLELLSRLHEDGALTTAHMLAVATAAPAPVTASPAGSARAAVKAKQAPVHTPYLARAGPPQTPYTGEPPSTAAARLGLTPSDPESGYAKATAKGGMQSMDEWRRVDEEWRRRFTDGGAAQAVATDERVVVEESCVPRGKQQRQNERMRAYDEARRAYYEEWFGEGDAAGEKLTGLGVAASRDDMAVSRQVAMDERRKRDYDTAVQQYREGVAETEAWQRRREAARRWQLGRWCSAGAAVLPVLPVCLCALPVLPGAAADACSVGE
eukprot:2296384-Prymnesium_polylepis.1